MIPSRTALPVSGLNAPMQVLHPNPSRVGFIIQNNSALNIRYSFETTVDFPADPLQAHLLAPGDTIEIKEGEWKPYDGPLTMQLEDTTSGNVGFLIITEFSSY